MVCTEYLVHFCGRLGCIGSTWLSKAPVLHWTRSSVTPRKGHSQALNGLLLSFHVAGFVSSPDRNAALRGTASFQQRLFFP